MVYPRTGLRGLERSDMVKEYRSGECLRHLKLFSGIKRPEVDI